MGEALNGVFAVTKFVDRISIKIGQLFSWLLIPLILAMCYEIAVRYFFGKPTMWSYDLSYMLSSLALIMGVAWVHADRSHVNVDIFVNKFPARLRTTLNMVFSLILFFPAWGLILWYMFPDILYSWSISEKASTGTWRPIIYPFKLWIFIGLAILMLQAVNELVKDVIALVHINDNGDEA